MKLLRGPEAPEWIQMTSIGRGSTTDEVVAALGCD
eukprot:COSAG02_NODE_38726_length_425_cov_1.751534_1_plen_34_part_01